MTVLPNLFKVPSLQSSKRASLAGVLLTFALISISTAGSYAAPATSAEKLSPDVLVLVMRSISSGTSNTVVLDQVSISYDSSISEEDAKKDLYALNAASGWEVRNGKVTTKTDATPRAKLTTTSSFFTQPIINYSTGVLPLEPFVTAFKRFKTIQLIFLAPDIQLRGPKDFENKFVKIQLTQSKSTCVYKVDVKDGSFTKLDLVAKTETPNAHTGMSGITRLMLAFSLAALTAVLAFVLASRLSGRGKTGHGERENGT